MRSPGVLRGVVRRAEAEPATGVGGGFVSAARHDDVDDEEGQADQAHGDAGDRQPQGAGDQTDDQQHKTDEGGRQGQGQHVIHSRRK